MALYVILAIIAVPIVGYCKYKEAFYDGHRNPYGGPFPIMIAVMLGAEAVLNASNSNYFALFMLVYITVIAATLIVTTFLIFKRNSREYAESFNDLKEQFKKLKERIRSMDDQK